MVVSTDTSVIIAYLTPDLATKNRSITHINNNISSADAIQFSRNYIDLTDNTYISTTVVKRVKLD